MNSGIIKIRAREIVDSRGNPTVEVEIRTKENVARAAVPSGASTGIHEALELRDKEKRFHGKGVLKAVGNVNKIIAKEIIGRGPQEQEKIDQLMLNLDATKNKSKLGANAILGVSMAITRLASLEKGVPLWKHLGTLTKNKKFSLPTPALNIINGGKHAGNNLDIQEYMILPTGEKNFHEKIRIGCEVYHYLKEILRRKYGEGAINVGDEGGFAPPLTNLEEPLDLILEVLEDLGYEKKVKLGLDCAASEFYLQGKYKVEGSPLTPEKLTEKYRSLFENYPLISMEDPFAQDDWDSWKNFTRENKGELIIGDDLLVTNVERIKKAIQLKACNGLLLKINQIGTISESIEAFKLAKKNHWTVMVSHRSGETEDSFIADLSVGLGAEFIKAGAPCRGERLAKYNQLLRIEEELR